MPYYRFPFYLFLPLLALMARSDEKARRIPNRTILFALILYGLSTVLLSLFTGRPGSLSAAAFTSLFCQELLWAAACFLLLSLPTLLDHPGLGMGDVKLLTCLFLYLGPLALGVLLLAMVFTLVRALVVWLFSQERPLPSLPLASQLLTAALLFVFLFHTSTLF